MRRFLELKYNFYSFTVPYIITRMFKRSLMTSVRNCKSVVMTMKEGHLTGGALNNANDKKTSSLIIRSI